MTDLEKAIELARKHKGLFGMRNREECCVAACQEMAEWKEQQMIDKACEWLEDNLASFWQCKLYDDIAFIDDFKKAMKGGEE